MIGCDCAVCRSTDPRDRRTRPSILIELPVDGAVAVRGGGALDPRRHVDRSARAGAGQRRPPRRRDPLHAQPRRSRLRPRRCAALQRDAAVGDSAATRDARHARRACGACSPTSSSRRSRRAAACRSCRCSASAAPFSLGGVEIVPVPLLHGALPILGFRIGSFAYLTDCNRIPDESWPLLDGVRTLVLDALRHRPHPTHFSVAEALDGVARIGAERAYFTHICHDLPHAATCARCPPAWSWPMMGWCSEIPRSRSRARSLRALRAPRLGLHGRHSFPGRPAAVALGPAGARARQLRRRASRPSQDPRARAARRRRARRDVGRDDLRSASAARRPARQGAAAADDEGAEARGDRRAPACRARRSSASRRSCRGGSRRRSCGPCSSTGCASPRSGSAPTFCSATIAPATSRCCATLGARYGFKAEKIDPVRYKDFVVSSTRIRRLVSEGRVDEAGALLGHQYFLDGTVVRGDQRGRDDRLSDGEPLHRQRAAAAARRLRDDGDDRRHRASVGDQHRRRGRRSTSPGARSIETHIFDLDRDLYGATIRVGFVQRLRDERAFESLDLLQRADRRRLPAARACSSIGFHCRIPESCPIRSFSSRSTCPATRALRRHARPSWRAPCSATSAARSAAIDARDRRSCGAALTERAADGTPARATCGSARTAASSRSSSPATARADWRTTWPLPAAMTAMRLYNTLTRSEEDLRARRRTTPSACTPAA